jgi:hypothetical protein
MSFEWIAILIVELYLLVLLFRWLWRKEDEESARKSQQERDDEWIYRQW